MKPTWVAALILSLVGLSVAFYVLWPRKKAAANGKDKDKDKNKDKVMCTFGVYEAQDNDGVPAYKTQSAASLDACKQACCEDNKCRAAQFNSKRQQCLLKADVGAMTDAIATKTLLVKQK